MPVNTLKHTVGEAFNLINNIDLELLKEQQDTMASLFDMLDGEDDALMIESLEYLDILLSNIRALIEPT